MDIKFVSVIKNGINDQQPFIISSHNRGTVVANNISFYQVIANEEILVEMEYGKKKVTINQGINKMKLILNKPTPVSYRTRIGTFDLIVILNKINYNKNNLKFNYNVYDCDVNEVECLVKSQTQISLKW